MKITTRRLVRFITLLTAVFIVLIVRNFILMNENKKYERKVSHSYTRNMEELATSVDSLSASLEKEMYAGTGQMHRKLAQQIYLQCAEAKTALSVLPVKQTALEKTYRFLSQAGNYALAVSEKIGEGEKISDEDYQNISALYKFSKELSEDLWELEKAVSSGEVNFIKNLSIDEENVPDVISGFTNTDENSESYPRLIYDGPFSDNIMEKKPEMTKSAEEVTKNKALGRASMVLNINSTDFVRTENVDGDMPAWRFSTKDGKTSCEVTKQGGYVSYFLKSRSVSKSRLSNEEAVKKAEEFLKDTGIISMETTYYQAEENVLTVNFAYKDVDKVIYPDLVKVSIALDDGEILGLDSRGFFTNHRERNYPEKLFSQSRAEQEVSPKLEVQSHRLTVIPKENTDEVLCYEFRCKSESGRNVLVYINAQTGEEEQILILLETPGGTLTI